ncbi:MAG TPA: DnaJ domain-containing protein [Pseudonocardiaceae bacterium]|jgi:DnaJ-class molecular chaperone
MTHDPPDYYTVLGVASTASSTEIAHAYRCRVRSQHPDARPDTGQDADSEGMGEVIAAYAVLRDPARRADYDRQRQPTTNASNATPSTPLVPPDRTPLLRVGPVRYHGPPHRGRQ